MSEPITEYILRSIQDDCELSSSPEWSTPWTAYGTEATCRPRFDTQRIGNEVWLKEEDTGRVYRILAEEVDPHYWPA